MTPELAFSLLSIAGALYLAWTLAYGVGHRTGFKRGVALGYVECQQKFWRQMDRPRNRVGRFCHRPNVAGPTPEI